MNSGPPIGVIFDMDGVLVDSAAPHLRSWQLLAEECGGSVTNEQFANTNTWSVGPDGLVRQEKREIHFNAGLRPSIDARSDHGTFVFSHKWPTSDVNATEGLLLRESTDGQWVTGIAWERFVAVQAHNPWECMHLSIRIGPLGPGESKTIRGKIYLFEGDKKDLLQRYCEDFADEEPSDRSSKPR